MDKRGAKIGLLTLWKNANHGTALQAYALARVISEMGWEGEYILYDSRSHMRIVDKMRIITSKLCYLVSGGFVKSDIVSSNSYKSLMNFWDGIPHSSIIFNKKNFGNAIRFYYKYVVGGDQVWNPTISKVNSFYFLEAIDNDVPKYSYSPSFGTVCVSSKYKKKLVRMLSRFRYVGCRDMAQSQLLQQLIGREVINTVDPVLLLSEEFWHGFSKKLSCLPKKYLLCYVLGDSKKIRVYAEREAKERGLELIFMSTFSTDVKLSEISPVNFVSMFENANFVVTDSYHGMLYSVIFGKMFTPFFKRHGTENAFDNWRIYDLCNLLEIKVGSQVNPSKINRCRLNDKVLQSKKFLQTILND